MLSFSFIFLSFFLFLMLETLLEIMIMKHCIQKVIMSFVVFALRIDNTSS